MFTYSCRTCLNICVQTRWINLCRAVPHVWSWLQTLWYVPVNPVLEWICSWKSCSVSLITSDVSCSISRFHTFCRNMNWLQVSTAQFAGLDLLESAVRSFSCQWFSFIFQCSSARFSLSFLRERTLNLNLDHECVSVREPRQTGV